MPTTAIATLVTTPALKDFQVLLHTLEQWEPNAELFVLTDTPTSRLIAAIKSRLRIHLRVTLDEYTGLTRKDMEARSGRKYATLWHEFMLEKATVLEWVLETRESAWFLDADICLLAPLPGIPTGTRLGLSPHFIRPVDEDRFGRYNGGMIWIADRGLLDIWRRATYTSRFYEQSALEEVAKAAGNGLVEFPIQDNFGSWRYLQSADAPPVIEGRLGYNRRVACVGLTYEGAPLKSLHVHWGDQNAFNVWMRGRLEFLGRAHPPAKALVNILNRLHPLEKAKKE